MSLRRSVRSWLLGGTLLASVLSGPTHGAPAEPGAVARPQVWGYYPWWLAEHWRSLDLSAYDRLKFFEIGIDADGQLSQSNGWPTAWVGLQAALVAQGRPLDVTFSLFSTAHFESVFTSPRKRQRLLNQILHLAAGAQGIHLDVEIFEPVSPAAVNGYRTFVASLRSAMSRQGGDRPLTAFGVMGSPVDLYDRAAIARLDHLVVQGYDAHTLGSAHAGPIAPLRGPYEVTWEKALNHYLGLGVPRSKILMGVPFYGYEWPTDSATVGARSLGKGREITYAPLDARLLPNIRIAALTEVARHGLRRDPLSGSPYYAYQDASGAWRQGWFEDEPALAAKFEFIAKQQLAGIAIFPVGYDGGAFDKLLRRSFKGR